MSQEISTEPIRLQKVLAAAGVASRRTCEEMIAQGRVAVNGKQVREPGTRVDPKHDSVSVDGEVVPLTRPPKPIYIMLNKPAGVISTVTDPHAEKTVLELVGTLPGRVYPIGRLDADSTGLILLTNDGEFANRLTHPRYHVPKVYRVRVRGFLDRAAAIKLTEGIELPDGRTAPAEMKFVEFDAATRCTIVEMTLYEGRNRQVRRMMEAVGHPVRELTRIAFGNVRLKGLLPGTWRKLKPEEVEGLLEMAQPTPTPPREARRKTTRPIGGPQTRRPAPPKEAS